MCMYRSLNSFLPSTDSTSSSSSPRDRSCYRSLLCDNSIRAHDTTTDEYDGDAGVVAVVELSHSHHTASRRVNKLLFASPQSATVSSTNPRLSHGAYTLTPGILQSPLIEAANDENNASIVNRPLQSPENQDTCLSPAIEMKAPTPLDTSPCPTTSMMLCRSDAHITTRKRRKGRATQVNTIDETDEGV